MELPDISHLSKEEQDTILKVIKRHQDEDVKEQAMIKTLHQQFENYREQVQKASGSATSDLKLSHSNIKDLCSLCHKTKIAEGCGHTCTYCRKLFCSRCGGHVAVRSNKNERMLMYVCNLCRKKQVILTKTGAWHRAEQRRSSFSLQLESPPSYDLGKITGSASLAQLDSKNQSSKVKSKSSYSLELQMEENEPQLAKSEISPEIPPVPITKVQVVTSTCKAEVSKCGGKPLPKDTVSAVMPEGSSRPDQGVRRSSTHSERRLYRQEHAICGQQEFTPSRNEEGATTVPSDIHSDSRTFSDEGFSDKNQSNHGVPSLEAIPVSREVVEPDLPKPPLSNDTFLLLKQICQNSNVDVPTTSFTTIDLEDKAPSRASAQDPDLLSSTQNFNRIMNDPLLKPVCIRGSHELTPHGTPAYALQNDAQGKRNTTQLEDFDSTRSSHHSHPNLRRGKHHPETLKSNKNEVKESSRHQSPELDRSSPLMRHYPEFDGNICSETSPEVLPRNVNHNSTAQRHSRDNYRNNQGRRRSHSPVKKENRKNRRHASTRRKAVPQSDSNTTEHANHSCQPFRDRSELSSSCMNMGSANGSSMIMFDDVSSRVVDSHGKSDQCPQLDVNDRNLCCSDVDLPRSFCNYPTECQSHSTTRGRKPSSPNRRQNNSKHIPDRLSPTQRHKSRTGKHLIRKSSVSSTDEEMHSSPDYSSCEESEKKLSLCRGDNPVLFKSTESGYCSSCVNQRSDKQFVSWQPSTDGTCMVGQMVLNKSGSTLSKNPPYPSLNVILGIKVAGGKLNQAGELAAYVADVKSDSVADVVGRIKAGDEILKWNDRTLRGTSYQDVCKIISESKNNEMVRLIVIRSINDSRHILETRYPHPVTESRSDMTITTKAVPLQRISSHSISQPTGSRRGGTSTGKLQISIWYDDCTQHLYITVLRATELRLRPGGLTRNLFIKVYLLPDRSESSMKQTKIAKKTINPTWNQSLVYGNIKRQDLNSTTLELTMWDFDRSADNNCRFLGAVLIDLGSARIDDVPQWYKLSSVGESLNQVAESSDKLACLSDQHCCHKTTSQRDFQQEESHPISLHTATSSCKGNSSQREFEKQNNARRHQKEASNAANCKLIEQKGKEVILSAPYECLPKTQQRSLSRLRTGNPSSDRANQITSHRDRVEKSVNCNNTFPNSSLTTAQHNSRTVVTKESKVSTDYTSHGFHEPERSFHSKSVAKNVEYNEGERLNSLPASQMKMLDPSSQSQKTRLGSSETPSTSYSIVGSKNKRMHETTKQPQHSSGSANRERIRTRSAENVKRNDGTNSSALGADDTLSKSVSLGANLESQKKSKTFGGKRSSLNAKNSSSTDRSRKFFPQKLTNLVGLKSRSQSSSTLDGKKQLVLARCSEFGIHPTLQRDSSKESASGSVQSLASDSSARSVDKALREFVGDLGIGQIAGRQALTASSLGEIKLGIRHTATGLQVEIMRARGLVIKPNAKGLPAVLVKVYLMFEMQCSAKRKSRVVQVPRSHNPRFDQTVNFEPSLYGNSLQVIVWGDYGRLDSKVFMGIVQIKLLCDDSTIEQVGWYKLFPAGSVVETSLLDNQTGWKNSLESEVSGFRG